ncbi:MAG: ribonuclease activity regulator RraA [Rhodospirillaceae bacterium]
MDAETRKNLERISVATVSMQLLKRGFRRVAMRGVRPINTPIKSMLGPAYTLRFIPAREDLSAPEILGSENYVPRYAIEEVPEGAVLVVDAMGDADTAVLGDLILERLKARGAVGVVSDGGVRDAEEAIAVGLPVYCSGPAAPAHIVGLAAGDMNVKIGCGGVAVIPGDIIKADGDGVVVIPKHLAAEIAAAGPAQERYERFAKQKIQQGHPIIGVYPPSPATQKEYESWTDPEDT